VGGGTVYKKPKRLNLILTARREGQWNPGEGRRNKELTKVLNLKGAGRKKTVKFWRRGKGMTYTNLGAREEITSVLREKKDWGRKHRDIRLLPSGDKPQQ